MKELLRRQRNWERPQWRSICAECHSKRSCSSLRPKLVWRGVRDQRVQRERIVTVAGGSKAIILGRLGHTTARDRASLDSTDGHRCPVRRGKSRARSFRSAPQTSLGGLFLIVRFPDGV